MADFFVDQAAGLRRLFGGGGLQVVAFAAGCADVGRTLAVANLAAALARQGKNVLVLDENTGEGDVASCFGFRTRHDLLDVIDGCQAMSDVLVRPSSGVTILPASAAVQSLGNLGRRQQATFTGAMRHFESAMDVILVDAAISHPAGFSPLVLAAHETVMVVSPTSQSITESYVQIKKLSQAHGRREFRILVTRTRTLGEARGIFDNIADVAERRNLARLTMAGAVPDDEALYLAQRQGRTLVDLHPDAHTAKAFRDMASDLPYWRQAADSGLETANFFQQLIHLSQNIMPAACRAG